MSSCRGRYDQSSQCCSAASSAETSPSTSFGVFPQKEDKIFVEQPSRLGAGDGNRTHVASLEGGSSTIELHPLLAATDADPLPYPALRYCSAFALAWSLSFRTHLRSLPRFRSAGGGGRIRTYEDVRRQIYSLLPLTARQPLRVACRPAQRSARHRMSA